MKGTEWWPPSESISAPSSLDEIKAVYHCHDATIDICFVYGLSSNRDRTQTANGQPKLWLETLQPPKLGHIRVLTYGYGAYVVGKPVVSTN
jgi:hypothetical protein